MFRRENFPHPYPIQIPDLLPGLREPPPTPDEPSPPGPPVPLNIRNHISLPATRTPKPLWKTCPKFTRSAAPAKPSLPPRPIPPPDERVVKSFHFNVVRRLLDLQQHWIDTGRFSSDRPPSDRRPPIRPPEDYAVFLQHALPMPPAPLPAPPPLPLSTVPQTR